MTQDEILEEIEKCKASPYYLVTTYCKVINHLGETVPFTTPLYEQEFNDMANRTIKRRIRLRGKV